MIGLSAALFFVLTLVGIYQVNKTIAGESCPTNLEQGKLLKVGENSTYFFLNGQGELVYLPNKGYVISWGLDYNDYQDISGDCMDQYNAPISNAGANYLPGSYVVRHSYSDQLYVVEPGNKLAKISADVAKELHQNSKGVYSVIKISPFLWANYSDRGADITEVKPYPGQLIKIDKKTNYYVDENSKLHEVTAAGFTANKFQNRFARRYSASMIEGMAIGSKIDKALPHLLDMTQQTTPQYDPDPVYEVPTLAGAEDDKKVSLSWDQYQGPDLKYYHLVKSETNTSPQYPGDSSLMDSSDVSVTTYTDSQVAEGRTYYYRLCVENNSSEIKCGNVVQVKMSQTSPPPTADAAYFVRPGGGNTEQCTGKTNADYSGSGSAQDCAFSHPFYVFPPEGTSLLKGGETLIIADGSYEMGYGAPNTGACSEFWTWDCQMPTIPSGLSQDQPTRILGEGWNNGCSTMPKLSGTERPWHIVDLTGSDNVELQCLEITDGEDCIENHTGGMACERDNYPHGKWASTGLVASDSENVLLKNLDIHGLGSKGIHAGRLKDWTVEKTSISGNGFVGWDGDINTSGRNQNESSNSGTMLFKEVSIDWNGCAETADGGHAGCWGQSVGGYGDGLGTEQTAGDWIFEDSTFLHNTSDGLDLLYHRLGGTITVRRTQAEGNAGQQIKTAGDTVMTDNVVVGNCSFFDGQSFTHNVDSCRAAGTAIAVNASASGHQTTMYNNSVYSEGDCVMTADPASASMTIKSRNNIYYGDDDYTDGGHGDRSCLLWSENDSLTNFDNDYSLIYGAKESDNYKCSQGSHNICNSDPLYIAAGTNVENFNLLVKSNSPVIDKGIQEPGVTSLDFLKRTRPQGEGVDMGAYEVK